jgi:hypothetical protein
MAGTEAGEAISDPSGQADNIGRSDASDSARSVLGRRYGPKRCQRPEQQARQGREIGA